MAPRFAHRRTQLQKLPHRENYDKSLTSVQMVNKIFLYFALCMLYYDDEHDISL